MFEVTIGVIVLLAATGGLLFGLEMGLLANLKGKAVTVIAVMIGTTNYLYFMADADGKIGWGDRIEAEKSRGGKKKDKDGGGDGAGGKGKIHEGVGQGGNQAGGANAGGKSALLENERGKKKRGGKKGGLETDSTKKKDDKDEIETFQDCDICPIMVVVKAGGYRIGAPAGELGRRYYEGPTRAIKVRKSFAVSKFEITREQYKAFVALTGHRSGNECVVNDVLTAQRDFANPGIVQDEEDPVICVRWLDAKAYVRWLSGKTGGEYRLLSEAEWEYAARGGRLGMYTTTGGIDKMDANYNRAWRSTMPTGSFRANRFGIHDVHGNVWEWVEDCWHDSHSGRPPTAEVWEEDDAGDCSLRVTRGGGWDSTAAEVRSASRSYELKSSAMNSIGIRVAKTL